MIVIGCIAGTIVYKILNRGRGGGTDFGRLLQNTIIGFIGAFLGIAVGSALGLSANAGISVINLVLALAGTIIVMSIVTLLTSTK